LCVPEHSYIDAGELVGTGRTSPDIVDVDRITSHNTVRIPSDWRGPFRVVVVFDSQWVPGSSTWQTLVLEVP
jgi:hypothetical protein